MAKVKGYFKRKDKKGRNVVFVRDWLITEEEKKEVADLSANYGYRVEKAKNSKEKTTSSKTYKVDKEFDIPFDNVKKEHIQVYIEKFTDKKADIEKIEKFVNMAYSDKNGVRTINKKGEPTYQTIRAKKAFFEIFFPEKWEKEICPMLEERKFKKSEKKKQDDFFTQFLK